jgi:flagellin-like hook-associated protein FlgL
VGKLEDLDVAKTVVSLQKSNYIQTVASAMVNKVKSTMEAVLQLFDR